MCLHYNESRTSQRFGHTIMTSATAAAVANPESACSIHVFISALPATLSLASFPQAFFACPAAAPPCTIEWACSCLARQRPLTWHWPVYRWPPPPCNGTYKYASHVVTKEWKKNKKILVVITPRMWRNRSKSLSTGRIRYTQTNAPIKV